MSHEMLLAAPAATEKLSGRVGAARLTSLAFGLTACSGNGPAPATDQPTITRPMPSSGLAEDDAARADGEPTGKAAPSSPPDPHAPVSVKPVKRSGQPTTRVSARAGTFSTTVRYADDVTLRVSEVREGTSTGRGPGTNARQPLTSFALALRNGSGEPLDATQVVVALAYGTGKARLARPVYDENTTDFGTTVAPGDGVTAVYAFAVDRGDLPAVRLSVDLDARHAVAFFVGSAR